MLLTCAIKFFPSRSDPPASVPRLAHTPARACLPSPSSCHCLVIARKGLRFEQDEGCAKQKHAAQTISLPPCTPPSLPPAPSLSLSHARALDPLPRHATACNGHAKVKARRLPREPCPLRPISAHTLLASQQRHHVKALARRATAHVALGDLAAASADHAQLVALAACSTRTGADACERVAACEEAASAAAHDAAVRAAGLQPRLPCSTSCPASQQSISLSCLLLCVCLSLSLSSSLGSPLSLWVVSN